MNTLSNNSTAIKTFLADTGKFVYGSRWQARFAKDLGIKNGKTLSELLKSDKEIPQSVIDKCYVLMDMRKKAASQLAQDLLSRCESFDNAIYKLDNLTNNEMQYEAM